MISSISAAILSGGEGKRFKGKPKTELTVGGRMIILRMLDVIGDIFDEIIIVSNSGENYSDVEKCKIIGDIFPGSGPLGGIHAAMKESEKEALFIFAGDMPFLNKDLIIKQIEEFSGNDSPAMVPVLNDLAEPLHAIYRSSLADEIEKILQEPGKHSVRDLIDKINAGFMIIPDSPEMKMSFFNINDPSDLDQAELFLR